MFDNFLGRVGVVVLFLVGACNGQTPRDAPDDRSQSLTPPVVHGNEALNLLCGSAAQCSDGQACTIDLCVAGVCVHSPNVGCCDEDFDCDQDLVCATATCVLNVCIETPIVGCGSGEPDASATDQSGADASAGDAGGWELGVLCSGDDDCEDGDPCTDDICLLEGGVCLFATNPLCCEIDDDCQGLLACHGGECVGDRCSLSLLPECSDAGVDAGSTGDSLDASMSDDTQKGDAARDSGSDDQSTTSVSSTDGAGALDASTRGISTLDASTDQSTAVGDDTLASDDGEHQSTSRTDGEPATDDSESTGTSDSIDSMGTDLHGEGKPLSAGDSGAISRGDDESREEPTVGPFAAPGSDANAQTMDDAGKEAARPSVANGEMTGGACALRVRTTEQSSLSWLGVALALCGWRRRK